MSEYTQFFKTMEKHISPKRIEDIRRDFGNLAGYIRNPAEAVAFNGTVWETKIRTQGNQGFHHRWDGEPIKEGTPEAYEVAQWLPKYGYAEVDWSNNVDMLSSDPDTALVRLSVERVTQTIINSMTRINQCIWANGAGEQAFIAVAEDDFTGGVLSFKTTGTNVPSVGGKTVTASGKYHRFSNIFLVKGKKVDLINGTTHLPRTGARNMTVTSVGFSALDDTAQIVTVTGPTGKIAGLAVGDYFVTADDIDDGSTGGVAGASKAPFGMLSFFGDGNPAGTVAARYAGNIDATAITEWDTGRYSDLAESGTNLFLELRSNLSTIQKYGGNPDTLIVAPNVEAQWWTQFKGQIFHTDTLRVEGGYEGCYFTVGGKRLFFTSDIGAPRGAAFMFERDNIIYAVRYPFQLADSHNLLASGRIDKKVSVFKEVYNVVCRNRKKLALTINCP